VVVNGVRYSEITVDGIETDIGSDSFAPDEEAKRWLSAVSTENINVYRIRCYNTASVSSDDKYARRCSKWCVNNGYTVTCLELAKLLPVQMRNDGAALREKVLSVDRRTLREECRRSQDFDFGVEEGYITSYKQFVEMKKGDIVVLHTRGGSGAYGSTSAPPQTLTFGVLEDDELILMHRDDAMHKHGFPWDFCDPGSSETTRIGLMVRKVKWYRQGELRAVRGRSQASWLAEAQTIWLAQVGAKTEKFLKDAIKKMSSNQFLRSTHAIDNEWSMD